MQLYILAPMRRRPALLLLLSLLAAGTGAAQSVNPGDEPEAALPRYRVEVIVFAHRDGNPAEELFGLRGQAPPRDDQAGRSTEAAPAQRLEPLPPPEDPIRRPAPRAAAGGLQTLPYPRGGQADDDFGGDTAAAGLRFRLLRDDELQLRDARRRMSELSAYEVLVHGGWLQDGLAPEAAQPFDLAALGAVNPSGTIQLHVSRFLHVTVDLEYRGPETGARAASGSPFDLTEFRIRPRYRLQEQRRARSGELHYIDHPMFGVLVLVTPEPEEEE